MIQFILEQVVWTWTLTRKSKSFGSTLMCFGTLFVVLSIVTMVLLHSIIYNEEFVSAERNGKLQKSQFFRESVNVRLIKSQNTTVVRKQRGSITTSVHSLSELDNFPLNTVKPRSNASKHASLYAAHVSAGLNASALHKKVASLRGSKFSHRKFNMSAYQDAKTRRVSTPLVPIMMEPNLSPIKGYFVNYTNHYIDGLTTDGSYFRYIHNYSTPCYLNSISLKYDALCGDVTLPMTSIRQVLIVAVQRSGTHFTWEMLNRLNVTVHHEGLGIHGSVGWPFSVRSTTTSKGKSHGSVATKGFSRGYIINNPEKLRTQRFRYVFHQVRHPLRVISTLMSRCSIFDKYWNWIVKIRLEHFNEMSRTATPLTRAMLLYYYWNRHIESYADLRFQTETTSPRDICSWAYFNQDTYCNRNVTLIGEERVRKSDVAVVSRRLEGKEEVEEGEEEVERTEGDPTDTEEKEEEDDPSNSKDNSTASAEVETSERADIQYLKVTWAELDAENSTLSSWIKDMCVEYGFPLDPDLIPQNRLSRQFTA